MSNWFKGICLLILPLVMAGTIWATDELEPTLQNVKEALLKSNYYSVYTETVFRFGRRREEMVRQWVKDDYVIKQVQAPLWQWGEVTIQTPTDYYHYIPNQKSCLKVAKKIAPTKNRLNQWESWLKKADKLEETSIVMGRTIQTFSGNNVNDRFKLLFDPNTFMPLGLEIYRNNMLTKMVTVQKIEEIKNFRPSQMIPTGEIKWYSDENQFWQTVSIPRAQIGVNFTIIQPAYVPAGFVFERAKLEELSSATVVRLIYEGPGKQILSIFEREKLSENQKMSLNSLKSTIKDGGNEVNAHQWFKNQVHLVIIGPISDGEIKKMVQSM